MDTLHPNIFTRLAKAGVPDISKLPDDALLSRRQLAGLTGYTQTEPVGLCRMGTPAALCHVATTNGASFENAEGRRVVAFSHRRIVWIANGAAILILFAALFGWQIELDCWIGVDTMLREVAVGLWAVLLPTWFQLEERWAPTDVQGAAAFKRSQETGRIFWTAAGAAIFGIVLVGSPPKEDVKSTPSVVTSTAPKP